MVDFDRGESLLVRERERPVESGVARRDRRGLELIVVIAGNEKEGRVFQNRSAKCRAVIVLLELRLLLSEEIVSVERIAAQEVVAGPVKVVGARFRDDVDHAA